MTHAVIPALILAVVALAARLSAQTSPSSQTAEWTAERNDFGCVGNNPNGLRIVPCAGWVKTKRNQLEDFVFEFEWRAVAPNTDAVLALFGIEGQKPTRWTSVYGLSLFGQPPNEAAVAPTRMMNIPVDEAKLTSLLRGPEQWQWYSVSRNDDRLTIAVNGTQVVVTSASTSLDGWVGFRVNGGAIEIRDMRLASRPPSARPRMLARGGYAARKGNGVSPPKVRHEEQPTYTEAARIAKIEGTVAIEFVVDENGQVVDPQIVRSLDDRHGLDQSAIRAAKLWRFQPGSYQGKPVPVVVTIEMNFTLR